MIPPEEFNAQYMSDDFSKYTNIHLCKIVFDWTVIDQSAWSTTAEWVIKYD